MVKAGIITGYGINADEELIQAFRSAGAEAELVHITDIIEDPGSIHVYHILGFAGGFSFGDHLGSGIVFAHLCKQHLKKDLIRFVGEGKAVIGICNGFQVLAKMGMLPNLQKDWTREVSLIHNDSGVFEDSWVEVSFNKKSSCIWTKGLTEMDLPIRHGEGRFITGSSEVRNSLIDRGLIALTYSGRNPNGSELDIAGITDESGRVLGLMPHPEAFLIPQNHPRWTRDAITSGEGLKLFQNGVDYIKKYFHDDL